MANVAQRAMPDWWGSLEWGYELYDRGKSLDFAAVSPYDLYPTLSVRLIWEQILAETGFGASLWQSELLDKLMVPAANPATLSEAFRAARKLRVGLGPGHEDAS